MPHPDDVPPLSGGAQGKRKRKPGACTRIAHFMGKNLVQASPRKPTAQGCVDLIDTQSKAFLPRRSRRFQCSQLLL
jgi:hypothetical protein